MVVIVVKIQRLPFPGASFPSPEDLDSHRPGALGVHDEIGGGYGNGNVVVSLVGEGLAFRYIRRLCLWPYMRASARDIQSNRGRCIEASMGTMPTLTEMV